MKLEIKSEANSTLLKEVDMLRQLKGVQGVPELLDFQLTDTSRKYIVMELLD
jgi:predicted Ser/Thr protein kinase